MKKDDRPLSKPAPGSQVQGAYGTEDRNVSGIHENLSTGVTKQLAAEVEFPKKSILGLSREEIKADLINMGEKPYRAEQIWYWVYNQGVQYFEQMTNLPISLRKALDEKYSLNRAKVARELVSFDGTRKWLLRFADGNEIETVFIPDDERGTLCISSQVGCTLTCKFCHTGTQKLVRNLEAHEILLQLMHAKDVLEDWPATHKHRKLTNIVMMGMGEPLLNYDNVSKALKIIMETSGIGLSKRKITLSTSGIVPMIKRCGEELGVNLAISLHAVNDDLRDELVPINRKHKINALIEACRRYAPVQNSGRKITWEYVMLKGINDNEAAAHSLLKLIEGIPSKINLIPFNPWPGSPYERSTPEQIARFAKIIEGAGYIAPVRTPRGDDIMAACGQLKSESMHHTEMTRAASLRPVHINKIK